MIIIIILFYLFIYLFIYLLLFKQNTEMSLAGILHVDKIIISSETDFPCFCNLKVSVQKHY